jgi:hypothetical protein
MKKTYVTPQMETFSIETQGFLAASANVEIVSGEFSGDFNSREFDIDDIVMQMN